MSKGKLALVLALLLPALLPASQRVIVIEDFTATWCQYCPGAARGIDELDFTAFDTVVAIAYHPSNSGDPYYTTVSATRESYYGVSGYPTVELDGNHSVVGGVHTGTMYPTYRAFFDTRKTVSSPLEIDLSSTYDTATLACHLQAVIRNTTSSAVSGQFQVAIVENHIHYSWQGMDSLQFVVRDMLPDGSGEAVTIPANDSLVKTRDLTLNASWVAANCQAVVFVQNTSTKQMYQGARIAINPVPELAYLGYEHAFARPDSDVSLVVGVRNLGSQTAAGLSGTLSTSDPYVTVTSASASFPDVAVAGDGYSLAPFQVHVAADCPGSHVVTFGLALSSTDGYATSVSFPMVVTLGTGFSDDFESGVGGWTHSGIRDQWHQTAHSYQSPTHSWYCGNEGTWVYQDEEDARLVSPFFPCGEGCQLTYNDQYATQAGHDLCYVETNNGSPFWVPVAVYSGSSGGWSPESFDLTALAGQTQRIRFRFISDYSTHAEGWYIDDFVMTPYAAAVADPGTAARWRVQAAANPVRNRAVIAYSVPAGQTGRMAIYDVSGHVVARLAGNLTGSGDVTWSLTDASGRRVPAGTYFARLSGAAAKVLVAR